jgi:hypothetical protein
MFAIPELRPRRVRGAALSVRSLPAGALCHVFSQKNWARYFAIIARQAISPK